MESCQVSLILLLFTIQAENRSINEDIWKEDETSNSGISGDIEFDAVNFTYPARQDVSVLRNLCLVAREGQTTALVGSSGCGQSLLKIYVSDFYSLFIDRKKYMYITSTSSV